ncbi:MAG: translation initiation factor [Chloroflexota bacterium]
MPKDERPTVYSTESGLRKPSQKPARLPARSLPPNQQTVYLHRESKGRGGKTVTLVKNLQLSPDDLKDLARQIKQACGVGGTLREDVIEIQGDQREKIAGLLKGRGFQVKIAGG